jgi:geranylgeranylglycerol-phosphate geranylgeranyltransferase
MTPLKGYLAAIRPLNCLMGAVASVIGGFVSIPALNASVIHALFLASVVVFMITGGGNSINDYFDVEIDKINKPERPVPSGILTRPQILVYSIALLSLGVLLSIVINFACLAIAIVNSASLALYSWKFKRLPFVGNVLIGYLTGSTFLFGGAAVSSYFIPAILFLSALLAISSREVIKDVEDMRGDAQVGATTLPIKYGARHSLLLAACLMFFAISLSPVPFLVSTFGYLYLSIIVIADTILMYSIALSWTSPSKASTYIKYGMLVVLVAYIFGRI